MSSTGTNGPIAAGDAARASGLAAAARVERVALLELADGMATSADVEVTEAPRAGSIMLELESPSGPFCVGETVVTTCSVMVGGRSGWGCVMGWDASGALAAALVDAHPGGAGAAIAATALGRERAHRDAEMRAIARTRLELA